MSKDMGFVESLITRAVLMACLSIIFVAETSLLQVFSGWSWLTCASLVGVFTGLLIGIMHELLKRRLT